MDALKIVSEDPNADAILLIHAPSAIVSSSVIAKSLVPTITEMETPLFSCWLGGDAVAHAVPKFDGSAVGLAVVVVAGHISAF